MQDMKEFVIQFRSWFWGRFFKHNTYINIACLASNALCLRTKKIHHFYTEAFQIFHRQLSLLDGKHVPTVSHFPTPNNLVFYNTHPPITVHETEVYTIHYPIGINV